MVMMPVRWWRFSTIFIEDTLAPPPFSYLGMLFIYGNVCIAAAPWDKAWKLIKRSMVIIDVIDKQGTLAAGIWTL